MYIFFGIICIAFTAFSGFYVERRRFNRRNFAGVQEFSTYAAMVKARAYEGALITGGVMSGLAGVIMMVAWFW